MTGNILLTSAGRRVQLVRFFQGAVRQLGVRGRVVVCEATPEWSAAARIADGSFRAPLVTDAGYEAFLLDLVEREDIRLVVPTIDTELRVLSAIREKLEARGCHASVSDAALVEICRDKRRSDGWFRELGFETPRMLDRATLTFPCFVKPYDGSLSRGARALLSVETLSPELLADEKLLFLEYLNPRDYSEFTVDCYYDRGGDLKCLVPRKRVEVRGGEISKGVALKDWLYHYLRERLDHIDGARGCLTFQFFASRSCQRCVAIELNPRFGGGYPLSHAAGADYPAWLIREYYADEKLPMFEDWADRTAMVRYDSEIVFTLPPDDDQE